MRNFAVAARYSVLRMLRNVQGLVVGLGMPLLIIPILGAVFSWIPKDEGYLKGATDVATFFAIGIILMFQLFGGSYCMVAVSKSFLAPMKWRLRALPCSPMAIIMGILAASTLMTLAQGILLVVFSAVFVGARFGNLGVTILAILGTSLVSQLIGLVLVLLTRRPSAAYVLGWVVAYGSAVLGGLIFPLPTDVPFFRFTATYGTPFSLAQTAMLDAARGGPWSEALLCAGVLFAAAAVLGSLTALLGRRRLA